MIDFDTVIDEEKKGPKREKSPLKTFEEYRTNLFTKFTNVVVIVNNPCLEFWFLLHFEKTSKFFSTCKSAEAALNKHIPNYEKTQKFYTKQNDDIYLKLKPFLSTGLANATALGNFDEEYPKKALCEMEFLFHAAELKKYFE
ncbi:MAG: RloB domain-containing protein [Sphingobacteriales bacterium]|nr:RloB domain-containing protein [Sphingobacteriales bacterium]MBK6890772.1 RloB domain-containing protein [Sphingobacteriales bacterium]MBK7526175.1 RloB domain-containing protein [Sphingobacteriales bacterium]MBK8677892.1 RloB domain-containing protein [Sphingobacteriales bacterium]MBL0247230.1 RloB domain-containing protein [Sphingobacteriales bacterium]